MYRHRPPRNRPSFLVHLVRADRLRRRFGLSWAEVLARVEGDLKADLEIQRRAAAREDADHPSWAYGQ
jgi:hypothetical protein